MRVCHDSTEIRTGAGSDFKEVYRGNAEFVDDCRTHVILM